MTKPSSLEPATTLDLTSLTAELRAEAAYERQGHTARTVTREDDLRVVLMVMKAGSHLPEHRANSTVSVQIIVGRVRLRLPAHSVELHAGQVLILERGLVHDVTAFDESVVLLTMGWHTEHI